MMFVFALWFSGLFCPKMDVFGQMQDDFQFQLSSTSLGGLFSTTMIEVIYVPPLPSSGGHDHVSPNFRWPFEPPSPTVDASVSPCKFAHCGATQSFSRFFRPMKLGVQNVSLDNRWTGAFVRSSFLDVVIALPPFLFGAPQS